MAMTPEEWKELGDLGNGDANPDRFTELLNKTEEEEEHPDDYDGACMCRLCCSYGD